MTPLQRWERYQRFLCNCPSIGLRLDISRMGFDDGFIDRMRGPVSDALAAMAKLEGGAIANPDEQRMVGHYWLRAPQLAPSQAIRADIERAIRQVQTFASGVHAGRIKPQTAQAFFVVLVIGIGGSSLGPQFISDALGQDDDSMILRFLDNTDPDGIDRVLADLEDLLPQTLTVVISKSGGTRETRNTMLEVAAAYDRLGLSFAKHAVAVTQSGSELDRTAAEEKWLAVFPIWDWVGGRTSVTSAVGLLPAALQGIDTDAFLDGAREADKATRVTSIERNPAAMAALMWHWAGEGRGARNLVVLPYRDRLAMLGKYLQMLVMESIGRERDRGGRSVHQGLTVYGNKGSSDQHSMIQQWVAGPDDCFATFVEVLRDRACNAAEISESDVTIGDHLDSALHATRHVLAEHGRQSMTLTLCELSARSLGVLIALFERTVGLYAELINVNAYHQPAVEEGKKGANDMLDLHQRILSLLRSNSTPSGSDRGAKGSRWTVDEIASALNERDRVEIVFHILEHACANPEHGIVRTRGSTPFDAKYSIAADEG